MRSAKLTALLTLLFMAMMLQATQYHVVGEVFTSASCPSCPDAREGLFNLSANQPELFIPVIWESNNHTSPNISARANMYDVSGVPHAQFSGTQEIVGGGVDMLPYYTQVYNNQVNYDSPIEMTIDFGRTNDGNYLITADCEVTGVLPTASSQIVFIITRYWSDSYFCTVARYSYESFTLANVGDTGVFTHEFDGEDDWNLGDLQAVVMVQDFTGAIGDKRIIQAGRSGITDLTAQFSCDIQSGPAQLGVMFSDRSIPPDDIVAWAWDFDEDGEIDSNSQYPYFLYTEPGEYDVTLTVTDSSNETSTETKENFINVVSPNGFYGEVSGIWTVENSPYVAIDDVEVPDGCHLIIAPGVAVQLQNGASFDVQGSVQAGSASGVITSFTGGPQHHNWASLKIQNTDNASSFTNCYFSGATETALVVANSEASVDACIFAGNQGGSQSGAIQLIGAEDAEINSSMFLGNSSSGNAGAIGADNATFSLNGALIVNNEGAFASAVSVKQGSTAEIVNCTIANNLNNGSTNADIALFQSTGTITNCIISSHNPLPVFAIGAAPTVTYSNITLSTGVYEGEGNINAWPQFVSPSLGEGLEYLDAAAVWRLGAGSPSIDTGNPDVAYNDMEDPQNPGSPLFPAMGALTADQGAYGGPTPCKHLSGVDVDEDDVPVVTAYGLSAYPNPFNPTTTLALNIPEDARNQPVSLKIYNVRGQRIATLLDHEVPASRTVAWRGVDDDNHRVGSGVYFARLEAGGRTVTCKMALIK